MGAYILEKAIAFVGIFQCQNRLEQMIHSFCFQFFIHNARHPFLICTPKIYSFFLFSYINILKF